jgi:hypothetical protein
MEKKKKKKDTEQQPVTVNITNNNEFKKGVGAFITNLNHLTIVMDSEGNMKMDAAVAPAMPQEVLGTNTVSPLPAKLATEQAMKYWKQLQEKNFVDSHYMLLKDTTRQQAAYIAELFAEKLEIKTKWKTFEDFWHISNLAQEKNQRTELGKLPSRASEIDKIFGD